jgi:hypothetical protein
MPANIAEQLADVEKRLEASKELRAAMVKNDIDVTDLDPIIQRAENMLEALRAAVKLAR